MIIKKNKKPRIAKIKIQIVINVSDGKQPENGHISEINTGKKENCWKWLTCGGYMIKPKAGRDVG